MEWNGMEWNGMDCCLYIPLDVAGSDLPSLPPPFAFHHQLMVAVLIRYAGF